MRRCFSALLARWGQTVCRELPGQEAQRWKAFVQPVPGRQGEDERAFTPLGSVDGRQWLYVGPAEIPLERGETLAQGDVTFQVGESVTVYAGEEPLYHRAVLHRQKEAVD